MHDEDISIHRSIARQDASLEGAARHRPADVGDGDAALCGARRSSVASPTHAQAKAEASLCNTDDASLDARQSRAAELLAGGMSVREVAALLDLHRGTIFRWRQTSPAFRREQQRCSARAAGELAGSARRLLVKATGYVERLMEDDGSRGEWAARILRNRRLWDLAMSGSDEATDDVSRASP